MSVREELAAGVGNDALYIMISMGLPNVTFAQSSLGCITLPWGARVVAQMRGQDFWWLPTRSQFYNYKGFT